MAELRTLLERAEEYLFDESPGARACLEDLDKALLAGFWKAELAWDGSGKRSPLDDFKSCLFYRRGLLRRLRSRGMRLGPGLLGDLYGAAGSPRLILLVTHACQLRCAYCRVRKYPAKMTPEVAEAGVRWLLGGLRREVEIQFFGGEPLLAFEVVRKAALLAESLAAEADKKVRFLLTTNGLALSDKALRFFRDHRFSIEFSCDGMPETQQAQRRAAGGKDYSKTLARNLESLRDAGIDYQVIAVVTPENVGRAKEEFLALAGLGHRRIQLNYSLGRYWDEKSARGFFKAAQDISALSRKMGVRFVNCETARREPVVLNSELTVDCDGGVFRETGVCLEEDFKDLKSKFFVTDVGRAGLYEGYGSTQFDNMALLAGAYGRGALRRVLVNNLEMGMRFKNRPPWKGVMK